jgi:hypothetical protein
MRTAHALRACACVGLLSVSSIALSLAQSRVSSIALSQRRRGRGPGGSEKPQLYKSSSQVTGAGREIKGETSDSIMLSNVLSAGRRRTARPGRAAAAGAPSPRPRRRPPPTCARAPHWSRERDERRGRWQHYTGCTPLYTSCTQLHTAAHNCTQRDGGARDRSRSKTRPSATSRRSCSRVSPPKGSCRRTWARSAG